MKCSVCNHPELSLINHELESGTQVAALTRRFDLERDALTRHKISHTRAGESGLLDPQELIAELRENLILAKGAAAVATTPRETTDALREIRQTTEALAKLTGAYKIPDQKHLIPFWSKLRQAILSALKDFPEAREAVLLAVENLQANE